MRIYKCNPNLKNEQESFFESEEKAAHFRLLLVPYFLPPGDLRVLGDAAFGLGLGDWRGTSFAK